MDTEPTTARHKPGDIVNGYRLTEQDGGLEWLPVEVEAKSKAKTKKWPYIAIGAVALVVIISTAANAGSSDEPKAEPVTADKPAVVAEAPKVTLPDVTGMTAGAAAATLEGLGYTVVGADDPGATVLSTSPAKGGVTEQGETVTLTVESKPKLTLAQENALGSAESYLDTMPFSRQGLIDQLTSDYGSGYPVDVATWAVDYLAPDWNAEAAEAAESYLNAMDFSRDGLYDQLTSEYGSQFTPEQANAGLTAAGY